MGLVLGQRGAGRPLIEWRVHLVKTLGPTGGKNPVQQGNFYLTGVALSLWNLPKHCRLKDLSAGTTVGTKDAQAAAERVLDTKVAVTIHLEDEIASVIYLRCW